MNTLLAIFISVILYDEVQPNDVLFAVCNGMLSVIITFGSLPLWEALFGVTTSFTLVELSNSDQKLIQRLLRQSQE